MEGKYIECKYRDTENNVEGINQIFYSELSRVPYFYDWYKIGHNITKETCTKNFYSTFENNLDWKHGTFLNYVDEDYLYQKDVENKINFESLIRQRKNLSEDFYEKHLKLIEEKNIDTSWRVRNTIFALIENTYNLSQDFLEKYIYPKILSKEFNGYYGIDSMYENLVKNHKITEKYFLLLEDNEHFKKFTRFIALINPLNDYSSEFIKKHRKDLNQKAFLNTEQVKELLPYYRMSDNALEVFKSRINWVNFINSHSLDSKILEHYCTNNKMKKVLFNLLVVNGDRITNTKNLTTLQNIMKNM